jgi:hypothetical protein
MSEAGKQPNNLTKENMKTKTETSMCITPTIQAVKALDGRMVEKLSGSELETLQFYRAKGRRFGVAVSIINKAEPKAVAAAKSREDARNIMISANSLISVLVQ